MKIIRAFLLTGAAAGALTSACFADGSQAAPAQTQQAADQSDVTSLESVVVTGTRGGISLLREATTVSYLNTEQIQQFAPASATDLLHSVPGIHIESSAGESNANISIRGLPLSAGGAKYAHIDEDGLPVVEFGDITFGNADGFVKADYTIDRLEVIRGGEASTFESNAPGGVFNFISNTGEVQGGKIGITKGIDYNETRLDFNYGSGDLGSGLRFDVGGYYHIGNGPLHAGFTAENGGQIKANITKEFDKGFFRISLKYLDDRTPTYLPTPFAVSGSAHNPTYSSVAGFDVLHDSFLSSNLPANSGIGADNVPYTHQVSDGFHAIVKQVGAEFSYEIAKNTHVSDKAKFSQIGGDFVSPYTTGTVGPAAGVAAATSVALMPGYGAPGSLTGSYFTYANGPNAGSLVASNAIVAGIVMFDVQLNSLNNFSNNFTVDHVFALGGEGTITVTGGYYKSRQEYNTDWDWNSYFLEVNGRNAATLNLTSTTGQPMTSNGLYAYGAEFWGQCCQRQYRLAYDTDAPFAKVLFLDGPLSVDFSLRYDEGHASGTFAGSGVAPKDVNGDGTISRPEQRVPYIVAPTNVDYATHLLSLSGGANYAFSDNFAVFARASRGGRTNADRLPFGFSFVDGNVVGGNKLAVNIVNQYEAGVKYGGDNFRIMATGFWAGTGETNYDTTTNTVKDEVYHAYGLELEGSYQISGLTLTAGGTYTHSRIAEDVLAPALVGNRPQRAAEFIYQGSAVYAFEPVPLTLGVDFTGTSNSFTGDDDSLVQPGYTLVNAFVQYELVTGLTATLNVNNVFDSLAITEVDNGVNGWGYTDARTAPGRTIKLNLKYQF